MNKQEIKPYLLDNEAHRLALHYALTGKGKTQFIDAMNQRTQRIIKSKLASIHRKVPKPNHASRLTEH